MTSRKFIGFAAFALSGAALFGTASAGPSAVELDPGLYDYTHNVYVNSQLLRTEDYEYCVIEGKNKKTVDELVADLVEGGNCTASGVSLTQSTGAANVSCTDPDFGLKIDGRLEADYGPTFYNVNATANIGGMQNLTVKTKVRRRSACPEGWNNPDDVSPD